VTVEERRLFVDHIRKLDRRLNQGMNKLTWQAKHMIEMYVKDCVSNCSETYVLVREFKECKSGIQKICKTMNSALLVRIDKNQIYEGGLFEKRQQEHRSSMCTMFEESFNKIMALLKNIYKQFQDGSNEVQVLTVTHLLTHPPNHLTHSLNSENGRVKSPKLIKWWNNP
jgi:dynein heavy chain